MVLYPLQDTLSSRAKLAVLREMLRTARHRHDIPQYSRISQLMQHHLHPVLLGERDPAEALEKLAEHMDGILGEG